MRMNVADRTWLDRCKAEPDRYVILVAKGEVLVRDDKSDYEEPNVMYRFSCHGKEFALMLLEYIGIAGERV